MTIKIGTKTVASKVYQASWGSMEGNITDQVDLKNALVQKAPLHSPQFSGSPLVPTPTATSNELQSVNKKYVETELNDFKAYVQEQIDANKIDESTLVHTSGNETINGVKTFTEVIQGTAYRAYWGDLAEYYESDYNYPRGTLVQFGGSKEITIADSDVNAVITSEPGFILNSKMENGQAIALCGRVPVRVIGKVNKFDYLTLSDLPGVARVRQVNDICSFTARALETKDTEDEGLVLCVVRFNP